MILRLVRTRRPPDTPWSPGNYQAYSLLTLFTSLSQMKGATAILVHFGESQFSFIRADCDVPLASWECDAMTSERPESREAGESVEEPILAWSPHHRSLLSSHRARLTQEWSHYTSWFLLINWSTATSWLWSNFHNCEDWSRNSPCSTCSDINFNY